MNQIANIVEEEEGEIHRDVGGFGANNCSSDILRVTVSRAAIPAARGQEGDRLCEHADERTLDFRAHDHLHRDPLHPPYCYWNPYICRLVFIYLYVSLLLMSTYIIIGSLIILFFQSFKFCT